MSSQDPENYSIDEMVQRLKRRGTGSADEELVTRADGTQMIRRRHRKRRSHQPERKPPRSSQQLRVIQLVMVVGGLGILLVGGMSLLAYHNSSAFIRKTEANIGAVSGAQVALDKFGLTPLRAQARGVELVWEDGGMLASAQFHNLGARINPVGFIGGGWAGEEVVAGEGLVRLQPATGPTPARSPRQNPYQFLRYRCLKLAVEAGDGRVSGTEGTLYLRSDASQLRMIGGVFSAPGWGEMPLGRASWLVKPGAVEVSVRGADHRDGRGELAVAGTFDPRAATAALNVTLEDFPLAEALGSSLGRLVSGRVAGSGMLSFCPQDSGSARLDATFKLVPREAVVLTGLPVFAYLQQEFQDPGLGSPRFETAAEGLIERSREGVRLSALRLEQRNGLAVAGNLATDQQGNLSGTLELGISDRLAMLATTPEALQAFPVRRDGYRWVKISLSGTVSAPRDNFIPARAAEQ